MKLSYSLENEFLKIQGFDSKSFDVRKTLFCGQCFRWTQPVDNEFVGIIGPQIVWLRVESGEGSSFSLLSNVTQEYFEKVLYPYFSLDCDYESKIAKLNLTGYARESYLMARGIRILRQDPWETFASFIISQNNNIQRIAANIESLCELGGYPISAELPCGHVCRYTFPSAGSLYDLVAENSKALSGCHLGYRESYLIGVLQSLHGNFLNLTQLAKEAVTADDIIDELIRQKGVGLKVASCVALFGFNKLEAFPIDVWVTRILSEEFPPGFDYREFGEVAGLIQQYMFYNKRMGGHS